MSITNEIAEFRNGLGRLRVLKACAVIIALLGASTFVIGLLARQYIYAAVCAGFTYLGWGGYILLRRLVDETRRAMDFLESINSQPDAAFVCDWMGDERVSEEERSQRRKYVIETLGRKNI